MGKMGDGEGVMKNIDTNLLAYSEDKNQIRKAERIRDKVLSGDPAVKVLYQQENLSFKSPAFMLKIFFKKARCGCMCRILKLSITSLQEILERCGR